LKHETHSIKNENPSIISTKAHFASTTLSIYTIGLKFVLKKSMNNYTRHIMVNHCFTTNLETEKQ